MGEIMSGDFLLHGARFLARLMEGKKGDGSSIVKAGRFIPRAPVQLLAGGQAVFIYAACGELADFSWRSIRPIRMGSASGPKKSISFLDLKRYIYICILNSEYREVVA